jgi:RNA polymerase sigma-70 factor (ECF subfamily)
MSSSGHEITELLHLWSTGDHSALDRLMPLVYGELRKRARNYMRRQDPGNTLQATAVIHEAYLKLINGRERNWQNQDHFFAVAAKAMRQVLVDSARSRLASKRSGQNRVIQLDEGLTIADGQERDVIALDDALSELAAAYPRHSQVVELRYFGGLSVEETARVLRVSPETVARDWRFAKSFLGAEMRRASPPRSGAAGSG